METCEGTKTKSFKRLSLPHGDGKDNANNQKEAFIDTKNIKKMFAEDNHNFWGQSVVEFENHLYAVELANNQVIDINLDAHTLENSIQITESESALDNSNQGIVFEF